RRESGEWFDYYSRYRFVENYRKRIEELEMVQKNLLKIFVAETEKKENDIKKNKFLINQLAKTIAENSKTLAEFGMAPPVIAKIKSMIPLDITASSKIDKNLNLKEKNTIYKNDHGEMRIDSRNAKSAIFPPIDTMDDINENYNNENGSTGGNDPNRVF
ncbi:MAG: hypothetical protein ACTHKK_08265, partial [Candidatus Nitrosocosmicus sp.]